MPTVLCGLKAPSLFPPPSPPLGSGSPHGKLGAGLFLGQSPEVTHPYREKKDARASTAPEPALERWWSLRAFTLPPHGAAPGAAAGCGRALGNARAAGHRRLRKRLPVPASGEAGRRREQRWVFVGASVGHSDCQVVKPCRWDRGQYCGPVSLCVCACLRERERSGHSRSQVCVCEIVIKEN